MDILKYGDYEGTAELDMSRGVCRGKLLFIGDLVTYEAPTPRELQSEFERAVDDYIETCLALKRQPQKPLRGLFNVRISPEFHRAAWLRALRDNVSLNEVVVSALRTYLYGQPTDVHHHNVAITMESSQGTHQSIASGTAPLHWEQVIRSGGQVRVN